MCDTFIVLNNSTHLGNIIFAKNSDRQFNEAQYIELLPARQYQRPEKLHLTYIEIDQANSTHAVLLSKPHWIWGAEMGANEYGLVIGNEAVFSKVAEPSKDGIIGMDLLRLALERARNVDEAIEVITGLLAEFGQGGNCGYREPITYDNSFMIADGHGAQVLETAGREWVARHVENYYAISNTMTIGTDFSMSSASLEEAVRRNGFSDSVEPINFKSAFEDVSRVRTGEQRRQRSMTLLDAHVGKISISEAFQILRDHGTPGARNEPAGPGLCAHRKKEALGKTTGSMVSSLHNNKRVHWVTGTAAPCTAVFKPVVLEATFPEHGPEHGPKPGADEEDTSSLWWRHERLSQYLLDTSRNIIDPTSYVTERNALEAEFIHIMDECPAPTNNQDIHACREAVNFCWRKALDFENRWYELCT